MTTEPVHLTRDGAIALVLIDNPPVNALSRSVRAGLVSALETAFADPDVEAVVLACAGRTFAAGGDIREFGQPPAEPFLTRVMDLIENGPKPVVAALHGTALGGGFELALACHGRVMEEAAVVGLPEVKIGILPGAGGTQRLPRLIGMVAALDLITTARRVKAAEASKLGLVDLIVEGKVREAAIRHAAQLVGRPLRRTGSLQVPAYDAAEFAEAVAGVKVKARGQISLSRAAEMVALAGSAPIEEGLASERAAFLELVSSPQAQALRHAFFAEREVARVPHLVGIAPRPFARVGILGAGTMGAGIAVSFLDAGMDVLVVETTETAMEAGRDRIHGLYDRMIRSGRIRAAEKAERIGRLETTTDFSALSRRDLIVEAVYEDMAIKKEIFARLGTIAAPGTVLASNTSYLDLDEIASSSGRAGDVIGLHFFSPAHVMRLVEVVEGAASARDAVATGMAVARALGKIGVACGVCDGFIGNRILSAARYQSDFALEDGAYPHEIDAALEAFGFPMGPFAVSDLAGLDIGMARRKRLALTRDPRSRYPGTLADRLFEMGRYGQKTNAGWYRYVDGTRQVDPVVTDLIDAFWKERGVERAEFDGEALARRVRAVMINEGAKILTEGIASRALDIDVVKINGYGYPAWRGGPMYEADQLGAASIAREMEDVKRRYGFGWDPAPLLLELATKNGRFADLPPRR